MLSKERRGLSVRRSVGMYFNEKFDINVIWGGMKKQIGLYHKFSSGFIQHKVIFLSCVAD